MEKYLENYIHEHIPLSVTMGITVEEALAHHVVLNVPIAPNINHKRTVFGGSLHAAATLTCWSLVFINLKNQPQSCEIVISQSQVNYLAPVQQDFRVECTLEDTLLMQNFQNTLWKKGKSRIKLNAKVYQDHTLCVDYWGNFVAIAP